MGSFTTSVSTGKPNIGAAYATVGCKDAYKQGCATNFFRVVNNSALEQCSESSILAGS